MKDKPTVNIMWFRRDLRLNDNTALYYALNDGIPVVPVFIFDRNILDKLEDKADRRVEFIHEALTEMQQHLAAIGSSIEIFYGFPDEIFRDLPKTYNISKVFCNDDYEPYAIERDAKVRSILNETGAHFKAYKDHVVFEKNEILKSDGKPYTVFTPYSRKWKACLKDEHTKTYESHQHTDKFFRQPALRVPSLESMGFHKTGTSFPSKEFRHDILAKYNETRDFPGTIAGTSRLGVHLRFGTISIRQLLKEAMKLNETYVNELIWREFYQQILWHFPKVGKGRAFNEQYEKIEWRNNEKEFEAWCNGTTGYPIVDAGMRELNATGFMHNRVRMIVASFLTKHLLIDWHWGEAYFAQKLLDYELASNNGGWQWAAGSGVDAAPFFRIFNPTLQMQKFDKRFEYIKKWVPEFQEFTYPKPIVVHEEARKRALEVYGKVLRK